MFSKVLLATALQVRAVGCWTPDGDIQVTLGVCARAVGADTGTGAMNIRSISPGALQSPDAAPRQRIPNNKGSTAPGPP